MTYSHEKKPSLRSLTTEALVGGALSELDQRYGPVAEHPLSYHNRQHTERVIGAATSLANEMVLTNKIKESDVELVRLAAVYHDLVHGLASGKNEEESAKQAVEIMRHTGAYTDEEIDTVARVIMSTVAKVENGQIRQSAQEGDVLAQILCDADLSLIGEPFEAYWPRALNLERERLGKPDLSPEEIENFRKFEISFLGQHQFYTDEAAELFPHKQANIEALQSLQL